MGETDLGAEGELNRFWGQMEEAGPGGRGRQGLAAVYAGTGGLRSQGPAQAGSGGGEVHRRRRR